MSHIAADDVRVSSRALDTVSQEGDLRRRADGQIDETLGWYRVKFTGETMACPGLGRRIEG